MTSTQPSRRSWFFRQSWLVQFALVFFGAIALLSVVVIFWGMSASVSSDGGESGSNSDIAGFPTISKHPTVPVAVSPTTEVTASPTAESSGEQVVTATGPAATTDVAALEEIYAQAAESLKQPGMVYHRTITLNSESGLFSQEGVIEHWVDANENVVRSEISTELTQAPEPVSVDVTSITVENVDYSVYRGPDQRMDTTPSNTCYGANEAVSALLGCPGFTETSTTTIEHGDYEGQPAVILVKIGDAHGSDERWSFTSWLYLDAGTLLPIAQELEGTMDYGETVSMNSLQTFEHEFIPRDSLPPYFFDVVALAEDQVEAAEVSFPIYWLGPSFEPADQLPRIVLNTASPYSPTMFQGTSYDLLLTYRLTDIQLTQSRTVQSEVIIQEWSPKAWHAEWDGTVRGSWDALPCGVQHSSETSHSKATMFLGHGAVNIPPGPAFGIATTEPIPAAECGEATYNRYEAIVDLGETVLFIWLPDGSSYRSQAGLEAIVRGLEQR